MGAKGEGSCQTLYAITVRGGGKKDSSLSARSLTKIEFLQYGGREGERNNNNFFLGKYRGKE